ncbi:hypothetical protein DICPUDRAFT_99881 [Dictyostelium purpureum]|uniref:DSCP-N domain-containing protein n=1 Tax=Dictyostelium purpureum TaxID=5786 RepID=F1A3E3_DICPU|nr:uncharacterized protein DICPUDRAFT_99881 [Dictyostelium purpureum]EGC29290.1 hypothetical protein DICPUDRAFT_99881 [Dictyostelium purpureum]|eukprot:XP_003294188.1 hypothetical protein DICPUDRAFT_99881 [Dictyostelium purpureum]
MIKKPKNYLFILLLSIAISPIFGLDCESLNDSQCKSNSSCHYFPFVSCCGTSKFFCVNKQQSCSSTELTCGKNTKSGEIFEFWTQCKPTKDFVDYHPPNNTCGSLDCESSGLLCKWIEPKCYGTSCCGRYPACVNKDGSEIDVSNNNNKYYYNDADNHDNSKNNHNNGETHKDHKHHPHHKNHQHDKGDNHPHHHKNHHTYHDDIKPNEKTFVEENESFDCETLNNDQEKCQFLYPNCKWLTFQGCCGKQVSICANDLTNHCYDNDLSCVIEDGTNDIYEVWSICKPQKGFKKYNRSNATSCSELNCESKGMTCDWVQSTKCIGTSCCQKSPQCLPLQGSDNNNHNNDENGSRNSNSTNSDSNRNSGSNSSGASSSSSAANSNNRSNSNNSSSGNINSNGSKNSSSSSNSSDSISGSNSKNSSSSDNSNSSDNSKGNSNSSVSNNRSQSSSSASKSSSLKGSSSSSSDSNNSSDSKSSSSESKGSSSSSSPAKSAPPSPPRPASFASLQNNQVNQLRDEDGNFDALKNDNFEMFEEEDLWNDMDWYRKPDQLKNVVDEEEQFKITRKDN